MQVFSKVKNYILLVGCFPGKPCPVPMPSFWGQMRSAVQFIFFSGVSQFYFWQFRDGYRLTPILVNISFILASIGILTVRFFSY